MKICIYGAGAIGGYVGAKLVRAGCDVSLVARGPHREAIAASGLRVIEAGDDFTCTMPCVEDPGELGAQDFVIVTLKAHSAPGVAHRFEPLCHAGTAVVSAVNGVPWWYFHQLGGPYDGHRIDSVDPRGAQWKFIGPERVIGCVVYPSCEVIEPGVIRHLEGDRFTLGEPSGERTERIAALSDALRNAGLKAPIKKDIRTEIWVKLWGNLSFNPISALNGATLDVICQDTATRAVARAMMLEAQAIGEKLGVRFPIDVDKRIAAAAAVGAHKTSMLQDLERGRPMEIDALVGAVAELGRLVGVPTPVIDTILALLRRRAQSAGLA
jgi:2-dehydropantoate 2-reductase